MEAMTGRKTSELPQGLLDMMPPEMAEMVPPEESLGIGGLMTTLESILRPEDGRSSIGQATDLFQHGCKNLVDVTNFVHPAIVAIIEGGRGLHKLKDSYTVYNDSVTELIMEQVTMVLGIVQAAEAGIRRRAVGGQAFGRDPFIEAVERLNTVKAKLAPYCDNNAAAAVLDVLITHSVIKTMATYRDIANTSAARMRELRDDDEGQYAAAIRYTDQFGPGLTAAFAETTKIRTGESAEKFDRLRDTVALRYVTLRADGVLPADAAIITLGGESSFTTLLETYPLIDPNSLGSTAARINHWTIRLTAIETFMSAVEAVTSEGIQMLVAILEFGKAHSEKTFNIVRGGIIDVLDDFVPEVCEILKLSLLRDRDGIPGRRRRSKDAHDAAQRAWELVLSTLPEDAAVKLSADVYMTSFIAMFAETEMALHAVTDDLTTLMLDKANGPKFAQRAFNQLMNRLPGMLRKTIDALPYDAISVDPRQKMVQAQFSAGVLCGADPRATLTGAMLSGIITPHKGETTLGEGEKPEQPESGEKSAGCCGAHTECEHTDTPDEEAAPTTSEEDV